MLRSDKAPGLSPALGLVSVLLACSPAANEQPRTAPAEPLARAEHEPVQTTLWRHEGPEIVGVVDGVAYYWDAQMSEGGGIVSLSVDDGRELSRREIAGNNINGNPRYWLPAPGGYITGWDGPQRITETTAGQLEVDWRAPVGRWSDALVIDDMLISWDFDPRQAVVALSNATGEVVWEAPLEQRANGVELGFDGRSISVIWQHYSATSPTPQIEIPQRVRAIDPHTGETRWSMDFTEHTGGIAVSGDTLVVAMGADLLFFDGETRGLIRKVPTGHNPNVYPRFMTTASTVYVGLWDAVTAYDSATGEPTWRYPVALDGGPHLALAGELLLVRAAHTLVALDRETGSLVWEVGTAVGAHEVWASESDVVVSGGGGAVGFTLPAHFEHERARIRGQVELHCVDASKVAVVVGPERIEPGPDGRFDLTIESAGFVLVSAIVDDGMDQERPPKAPPAAIIELVGAGDYVVPTLVVDRCE